MCDDKQVEITPEMIQAGVVALCACDPLAELNAPRRSIAAISVPGAASWRSIPSVLQRDTSNARRKPGEVTAYPAPQRIRAAKLYLTRTG